MPVNNLIQLRKGSEAIWASTNPVLASGEPGYDTTNNLLKIGDGVLNWTALSGVNIGNTSFNSSVSGLLPVKDITAGSGISVSSSSGIYTITNTSSGGGGGAHASTHAATGSDPLTITSAQVSDFNSSVSGLIPQNTQTAVNLYLWSNFR